MFKKLLFLSLLLSALSFSANAQVSAYTFQASNGTFTPVSSAATAVPSLRADDVNATIPIGFSFFFAGNSYTNVVISSNGWVSFASPTATYTLNSLANAAAAVRPVLAPLWDDLHGLAPTSTAKYEVTGTAPNRVLTIEWFNWRWNYTAANPSVNFQVKLHETSGVVSYHYSLVNSANIANASASIGMSGPSSYLSVVDTGSVAAYTSSTTEYSTIRTVRNDRIYTFTPPSCIAPGGGTFPSVLSTSVTFSFSSPSGNAYQVEWGPAGFTQGTNSAYIINTSTTSVTVNGLNPSSSYDFYVRKDCGSSTFSAWTGPYRVTTACLPAAAPTVQSFNGPSWVSGTGGANAGDTLGACWSRTPTSGFFWGVRSGQTASGSTGPNAGLGGSGRYMFVEATGGSLGSVAELHMPLTDISSLTNPEVNFHYHMYGATTGSLHVDVWSRGTWTNSLWTISGQQQTSMNDPWISQRVSLANIVGDSIVVRFRAIRGSSFTGDIAIDQVAIQNAPVCPDPSSFSSFYTSGDSIALNWDSVAAAYQIEYSTTTFSPGTSTGLALTATDSFVGVGNLNANTTYYFYIRSNCTAASNGYSNWVGPISVRTSCNTHSMPYTETFDTWRLSCWDSTGGTAYWARYTGPAGDNYAEANFWSNANGIYVLRSTPINISVDALMRIKWSHLYSTSYPDDQLIVRSQILGSTTWDTLVDLKGATNFSSPGAQNTAPGTTFEVEEEILPNGYTGQLAVFEIIGRSDFGPDLFINDFQVEARPSCSKPINFQAVATSDSSITVSWVNSSTTLTNDLWFGPQGFRQGSNLGGGHHVSTTSLSQVIDTLRPNTCYDFYVRSICGAGDTSVYSGPVTVCTPCVSYTMPYYESFNTWPLNCWDVAKGTVDWAQYTNGTLSVAEADFWGNNGDTMIMLSPQVFVNQNAQVRLKWSHLYSSSYPDDQLVVRSKLTTSSVWDTLLDLKGSTFTAPGAQNTAPGSFIEEVLLLPTSYTNNTVEVELIGVSDWGPSLFIEDFHVEKVPSCFTPVNLSSTAVLSNSATINWSAHPNSTGNTFQYSFDTSGVAGAGTRTVVTGTTANLTGLMPNTQYCVFVREICAAGDTSNWSSNPHCFNTPCVSIRAPFKEDFETSSADCWQNETVTGNKLWTFANGAGGGSINSAYSGTRNARFTSSSGGPFRTKLVSPLIDASSLSVVDLKFFYGQEEWFGDQNTLKVFYRINSSSPWIQIWADSSNVAAWDSAVVIIPSNSTTLQIAFEGEDNWGYANVIDDVSIGNPRPCPVPTNVATSNTNCNSITLTWNSNSGGSIINYVQSGQSPSTGSFSGIVTSPYTVTGLTLGTAYDFYIADTCGTDTSVYTSVHTASTASSGSLVPAFTYSQISTTATTAVISFDASTTVGGMVYNWDFGNGTTGAGVTAQATYTLNGPYAAKLVVDGSCPGLRDSISRQVIVRGINIDEHPTVVASLYPNPTQNVVQLQLNEEAGDYSIQLIDAQGRIILNRSGLKAGAVHELDLAHIARGMYVVKITGSSWQMQERLIVKP